MFTHRDGTRANLRLAYATGIFRRLGDEIHDRREAEIAARVEALIQRALHQQRERQTAEVR